MTTEEFVRTRLGHAPRDLALFDRALTHSSLGKDSYERLEFLGDRVLGLVVARWLYETHPSEPEGKLSRRYNALVARETCAEAG
ncbi:MAG: ribonuclease III domain-containing protein, partial [Sphingomicrobium sp.]